MISCHMWHELGEIIAERQIEGVAPDGSCLEVVIRSGAARPDPLSSRGDWVCPHQIVGLGDDVVRAAAQLVPHEPGFALFEG